MNQVLTTSVLGLGLMVAGCATAQSVPVQKAAYVFAENEQCPNNLTLKVGQYIEYRVYENVTTGYMWSLDHKLNHFNAKATYKPLEPTDPPIVGAGNDKNFIFTAIKPGKETIQMKYSRTWENSVEPAHSWKCSVTITE